VRELFAKQLIAAGVVTEQESTEMTDRGLGGPERAAPKLKERIAAAKEVEHRRPASTSSTARPRRRSHRVSPRPRSRCSTRSCSPVPDGFTVHPKLVKQLEQRREAFGGSPTAGINWAHAEALAFASLLTEGIPIRLTGQDTERGTFSSVTSSCTTQDRPGALRDAAPAGRARADGAAQQPAVGDGLRRLRVRLLAGGPETLVLWEAQFGDFANGAQVIIDQFITRAWPSGARPRA
jgi:2-oxoglutarate decarboxylase